MEYVIRCFLTHVLCKQNVNQVIRSTSGNCDRVHGITQFLNIGHLMKGKSGRFAKTIFYFLRADKKNDCTAVVTGKAINRGDGEGMQVPCTLNFKGHRKWIDN